MKPIILVVAGPNVSKGLGPLVLEIAAFRRDPPIPTVIISNAFDSFSGYFSIDEAIECFEQRTTFQAYLEKLAPTQRHPNPLKILSRAVNVLKLACVRIFQPRWSAERWESTT